MQFNKETAKNIYLKVSEKAEKVGLKLTVGLLVYSIILCVITVNLDRMYIEHKLKRAVENAFEQTTDIFSSSKESQTKKKAKKRRFFAPKPKQIQPSDIVMIDNLCQIKIIKSEFINKLIPRNIREWSIYNVYQSKDKENLLLDTVVEIKNLNTTNINVESVVQSIKAIYNTKYEYEGFCVVELADGSDFDSDLNINPLQTKKFHILVEMPKIAKSDNNPVDLFFDVDNQTYTLPVKSSIIETSKHNVIKNTETQVFKPEQRAASVNNKKISPNSPPKKAVKTSVQPPKAPSKPVQRVKEKSNSEIANDLLFN